MRNLAIVFVVISSFFLYLVYTGVQNRNKQQAICAAKGGTLVKAVNGYVCATVIK